MADLELRVPPDTPVKKHVEGLTSRAAKLASLKEQLQNIAFDSAVTFAAIAEDLPRLQEAKEARDTLNQSDSSVKGFFGDRYKGAETSIEGIEKTASFVDDCLAIPELENGFNSFLSSDFSKKWDSLKKRSKTLVQAVEDTTNKVAVIPNIRFCPPWDQMDMADLIEQLSKALSKPDALNQWILFNRNCAQLTESIAGPLLQIYIQRKLDFATLPGAFEYMIYHAVALEIYQRNPMLEELGGEDMEQAKTRMKELDEGIREDQKAWLDRELRAAKPLPGNRQGKIGTWTEGALLYNEIHKQRRQLPIRKLMDRAGKSIQKIKPCFLMSPLSVAQYLDPESFKFDLLVIDEASQMRPESALGALARADKIVVVGDNKQLPPTSFFRSADKDDEAEEEDFTEESIMDMACLSFRPPRRLSRHYRSQHESLIAFSNYHFYDNRLVLFPSPYENSNEFGLKCEYIGGTYESGLNLDEAQAIVKAAQDVMRKHPDRSLGIATMNEKQQGLIEAEMDQVFNRDSRAADYRSHWENKLESFFVKNLESVQGDERDAIFISTVYGPETKDGPVMQRFGPINAAGGHRRLNVLFSRAKKNMVLFTSLKPEDIKVKDKSSEGIRALKGFLTYASTRRIDEGQSDPKSAEPDSDFEVWVKEALESIGCEVHLQVGVAGYRIDLGVKHPRYPYGYLVGVECDGAAYHSSKSARERDIIRQEVLEGLGWRIYRIWSTDWFYDTNREFAKLKEYIENRLAQETQAQETQAQETQAQETQAQETQAQETQAQETQENMDTQRESDKDDAIEHILPWTKKTRIRRAVR